MLKKIHKAVRSLLPTNSAMTAEDEPLVLERAEHCISRKQISKNALTVLYDLNKAGYEAYLVGGCIRDLLLSGKPKDFDVATNATPEQVNALFRRARIVGRRFKIVHVRFGREVIEVTTFRAAHQEPQAGTDPRGEQNSQGMLLRDNVYGSLREDALRRDFTINALYYSVDGFRVFDYTAGLADLDKQLLRMIGDPAQRYREDPVRMLRVIRFAAKLGFTIEKATAAPIADMSHHLEQVAPARLFDEISKLFLGGQAYKIFQLMLKYDIFAPLFPGTARCINKHNTLGKQLIEAALTNTDQRIEANKPVTPAFLYASLLWPVFVEHRKQLESNGMHAAPARQTASQEAIEQQIAVISIPRRFSIAVREIWNLQYNLEMSKGKRAVPLLSHPRFRAAYDFLLMREQAGEKLPRGSQFWTDLQIEHPDQVRTTPVSNHSGRPRRRRSSGARRQPATD